MCRSFNLTDNKYSPDTDPTLTSHTDRQAGRQTGSHAVKL